MIINLGFSSCPNDTFIFDALVNKRISYQEPQFRIHIADVEDLNKQALGSVPDVTKVSMGVYPRIANDYVLLNSGSALGNNNGPLIISKNNYSISDLKNLRIAIPGINTTANLLMSIAFPDAKNKHEVLFSEIENGILSGKYDAGLIIHESRFTYQSKGLQKIVDLGEYWESTYNMLLPLGGIAIKRTLPDKVQHQINDLIHDSLLYAFSNPDDSKSYIKQHAQEMQDSVIEQHIKLYVNQYSIDLGEEGRKSIEFLFKKAAEQKLIPAISQPIFIS